MVLQMARQCEISAYSKKEDEAIEWLLENPAVASKWVEERILVIPEDPQEKQLANYDFLYMTDALLVKILLESNIRYLKPARAAIIQLDKNRNNEEGGFYGNRMLSWSTAKAISALSVAAQHFEDFPVMDPEYVGVKTGNFILIFAIMLAGAGVYMAMYSNFTSLLASFFMALMLATLLAYGKIGPKTFKELIIGLFKIFPSK
jgi:hypothetical protein